MFALVLDVPPSALLTPSPERPFTVAIANDVTIADRTELSAWICGDRPLEATDHDQYTSYVTTRMPSRFDANAMAGRSMQWQAAAGRLLGQFTTELDQVTDRLRDQFAGGPAVSGHPAR